MVIVRSNFFEDIRTQIVSWFAQAGIALPQPGELEPVLFAYFSVKRRLITARRRDVTWSTELRSADLPADQANAVAVIEQQARDGVDLTPRLSKSLLDPEFNDGLLDDWGIHHLHLGNRIGTDGFVERGGPLLFAMVRPETVYFIDLLDHGSFADDKLLQIVHDNWPEAIAAFRAPTIARSSGPPPTDIERQQARKRLTLLWQAADGTVYFPPGGGSTTYLPERNGKPLRASGGLSPRVVSAADHLRQQAIAAEQWVRENAGRIRDRIRETTGRALEELHAQFVLTTPLAVLETQTNSLIPLRFQEPATMPVQL